MLSRLMWLAVGATTLLATAVAEMPSAALDRAIDARAEQYGELAQDIWDLAEMGYLEFESSAKLQNALQAEGFEIETGVADIPTAFTASYGRGKPVIALMGEFDALPGLSQGAVPERSPIAGQAAGHGCGHHLFGVGSLAAAVAVKDWLAAEQRPGTIRFYGTPAEEGGSGKVYMVRAGAFDSVVAFAEAIGAPVYREGLRAQLSFPSRHPNNRGRVPFTAKDTAKLLAEHDLIVLVGGPFFEDIWHDDVGPFPPGTTLIQIENNDQQLAFNFPLELGISGDMCSTLEDLVAALSAGDPGFHDDAKARNRTFAADLESRTQQAQVTLENVWDESPMASLRALHEIAQVVPADTVIVDESITAFGDVAAQFDLRKPGDYFAGRGGGIGQGLAGAIGTQVAFPDRRIVALSGDGSAMYSIQALWSAVHHDLPIVFVILSNREYRVLKHNLDIYRRRFDIVSSKPYPHMDLTKPILDFQAMAKGMGMDGEVVTEAAALADAMGRALQAGAPYLLEVIVAGKR
jgi:hypothetical protein